MAIQAGRDRAIYASNPDLSRGRLFAEPPSATRNVFRRDCDRIIHSTAFRRLKHKTQVFVFHEGDHYRTRLTHTLEVAQVARSLARALGLDEDLAEGLALSHDLGHPPFGHPGERALAFCMTGYGGFEHNSQALRIVVSLEHRYPDFDGLNLTWEMLEGLVKHNGPLTDRAGAPIGRYREEGIPDVIRDYDRIQPLELWSFASLEAQVAAIADDIAYDAHDIDDGLRAGMFTLADIASVPVIGTLLAEIDGRHPNLDHGRRVHELVRLLMTRMIEDVMAETERRVAVLAPTSTAAIRAASSACAAFSSAMNAADRDIKRFLWTHMYRHPRMQRITGDAEAVVRDLFDYYSKHPAVLPDEWADLPHDAAARARHIANFIAGMTDRFALIEHARFFDTTPDLR
jgi:dGTPase